MKIFHRFTDKEPTKKFLWMTDIHLNAADKEALDLFFDSLPSKDYDGVFVTGDICNGVSFASHVEKIQLLVGKPLYFVLGNHDFFESSIASVRAVADSIENPMIHYLTTHTMVPLTETTALVGHDGWADARHGDLLKSTISLLDYTHIHDFIPLPSQQLVEKLHALGTEAVESLKPRLEEAFLTHSKVVVLMHPPPYSEACLYDNHTCDTNWGPHFVCKAVGDLLLDLSEHYSDKEILVLCGHAHHGADVWIRPNLHVITGHSELCHPAVQGLLAVE